MASAGPAARWYEFGHFMLDCAELALLEGDQPVRLGTRAMQLLLALVQRSGEVLTRETLEASAWPNVVLEQTSLRVHIGALRKALRDGVDGARYITNVPGRGYCFVAPVRLLPEVPVTSAPPTASLPVSHVLTPLPAAHTLARVGNLPPRLSPVVGRAEVTTALAAQLARRRLVSVVGPGGIGKTTVALAVAYECIDNYKDGVWFVDLAPLTDPSLIPSTLGYTFGLTTGMAATPEASMQAVGAFLRNRELLIVLDNCEQVIAAAALAAESLMQTAPNVHILATTREPLEAEGEWVHRLPTLQTPGVAECLSVRQALGYSAIQLFVDRATASANSFELTDATLRAVRQICRQVDGVPLALELAAARVDTLGIDGLAQRLDSLFQLLTRGKRTALPRHRTLEALIAWSHDLLSHEEQVVLRRLSVFPASFTLDSATRVVTGPKVTASQAVECVLSLQGKSLLQVEACAKPGSNCIGGTVFADGKSGKNGNGRRYRMLYMTRAYASQALEVSGEGPSVARQHAEHIRVLVDHATARWDNTPPGENAGFQGWMVDDMCAALDWALSPQGDHAIGIALVIAAGHTVFRTDMNTQYRTRLELAMDRVALFSPVQPQLELQLCATWFFLSGQSLTVRRSQSQVYQRALTLIEPMALEDIPIEVLYGMCVASFSQANYSAMARFATQLRARATGDDAPMSLLLAERMLVLALHHLGEHEDAAMLATRVMDYQATIRQHWFIGPVPRAVSMRIVKARILWLQGYGDQAVEMASQAAQHAQGEHPFALCQALALAVIPIALWRGEWQRAGLRVDELMAYASPPALAYWLSWAKSYRHVLWLQERPSSAHARSESLEDAWGMPSSPMELDMLCTHALALLSPESVVRVHKGLVGWCAPEVLRASAEKMLQADAAVGVVSVEVLAEAQSLLLRARQIAQDQKALAWELRAACSLARVWLAQDRTAEARDMLAAVKSRFTEGLGSMDLLEADRLLGECESHTAVARSSQRSHRRA